MGKEWFDLFEIAVREAEKCGLDIWIYDEDGWPSGYAGGLVPALGSSHYLKQLHYGYDRHEVIYDNLVAVYRHIGNNQYQPVNGNPEQGDLFFWYTTDAHYVDLLSSETVKMFIHSTHEKYQERFSRWFGKTIRGVFTDEPQLSSLPWSPVLPAEFEKRCGYDLLPSLWLLAVPGHPSKQFRYDFFATVSSVFRRSYTGQISQWCKKNHLAMTGHFASEDGLYCQLSSNSGVMVHYSEMQFPGIDHLGNRIASPVLMKQVSSVANQLGSGDTLSETFGCCGWDVPFSRLTWIWGRQSALGITTPCVHLAAYTLEGIRKRDYPAFFSYQEPWWAEFRHLNTWMTRLNQLMRAGIREVNTLVISPLPTVMSEYDGTFQSVNSRNCSVQFRLLIENLLDIQLDMEIGDQQLMEEYGRVKNGKLCIGNRAYSLIFVAECDSITRSTYRLLDKFNHQGGKVIFVNRRPDMIDFKPSLLVGKMAGYDVENRRERIEKLAKYLDIDFPVKILRANDMQLAKDLIIHTRRIGSQRRIHICNSQTDSTIHAVLTVEGTVSLASIHLLTGEREALSCFHTENRTATYLTIHPMENILIETEIFNPLTYMKKCIKQLLIQPDSIKLTDKNTLTIDQAYYTIDGVSSETMPVIRMAERLYELTNRHNDRLDVDITYTFCCNPTCDINELSIALEDLPVKKLLVNSQRVNLERKNWWIDKCIGEYDISSFVHTGKNKVVVSYQLLPLNHSGNINQKFETVRNRFFYPIEPENIYIRGNFDVMTGKYVNNIDHYRLSNREFTLTAPSEKKYGDLTPQGLWFYRGGVEYVFKIQAPSPGNRIALFVKSADCPVIQWSIGNQSGCLFAPPQEQDITDALHSGENVLYLRVSGTNRNVLGPHHHIKGRINFVGVNTFKGVKGFEDFISPEIHSGETWTDCYSFVPFGCTEIYLKEYTVSTSTSHMDNGDVIT